MRRVYLAALLAAGTLACGCGGSRAPAGDAGPAGAGGAAAPGAAAPAAPAAEAPATNGADRPLAEFEPVGAADAAMYLKVMRTAAERVRNMSAADKQALKTMRQVSSGTMASTRMPTPEQIAAAQRAGELMTQDAVVARELGVPSRFSSVESRVDRFLHPMTGSSGEDDEQMTPEHRAWLHERIVKFKERDRQDAAVLEPYRAELLALEKQVRLAVHPE